MFAHVEMTRVIQQDSAEPTVAVMVSLADTVTVVSPGGYVCQTCQD